MTILSLVEDLRKKNKRYLLEGRGKVKKGDDAVCCTWLELCKDILQNGLKCRVDWTSDDWTKDKTPIITECS